MMRMMMMMKKEKRRVRRKKKKEEMKGRRMVVRVKEIKVLKRLMKNNDEVEDGEKREEMKRME